MLKTLTHATFAAHLGETFQLSHGPSQILDLALIEVTALGPTPSQGRGRRAPFSIVFRAPHHPPLGQGTYRISHATLGGFDLFLVPIAPDEDGRYYEAVFA